MPIKKGGFVVAKRDSLTGDVALANDTRWPEYIFQTPGEVQEIRGDYAFVKFGAVPTPSVWLPLSVLEEKA
ncbi:NAD(P)H-quinone oxidoreductase subunit O [Anthocerotibacter panamensis]|uniref:NAD(P)H-quinone oxidoreductase subunit O n=1 Tax=Anthocerotibacter panamensis TaxID=2857077 RepID=UPI001C405D6E|nr:NAD(P)H-quinone oxidoreductase subunit O [Anthocerotibacter panamensis]